MQIFSSGPHLARLSRLRQLRLPAGDARISFVDSMYVAAVAATYILEQSHASQAYTLTGLESLSHADVTKILSEESGTELAYVPLSEDEARAEFAAVGLPSQNVERLIGFYRIVRAQAAGAVSPSVEMLLGRAPRNFPDFAREHASTWNFGPRLTAEAR